MTEQTPTDLIDMAAVMEAVPFARKALIERIRRDGIAVWVDGRDRRRRLIRRSDLEKLLEHRLVERHDQNAA